MAERRALYYDGRSAIWRDSAGHLVRDDLAGAGEALAGVEIIVLVPGEDILLTDVALPPIRQARRRLTAARFALEDRLAGRVEQLHFAVASGEGPQQTLVAVIDREQMQDWCCTLESAGLDVVRILPDNLALPRPGRDRWQIMLIEDRVLLRTGAASGLACSRDLWPILAAAMPGPQAIDIQATSSDAIHAIEGFDEQDPRPEITPHTHAGTDALIGVLLDATELNRHPLNLRQNEFARRSEFNNRFRPLIWTAALAATWLVVVIAGRAVETWQLDHRVDALHQQTLAAFQGAFPDVQNINDLRVQAEEGIRALRGGSGHGGLFTMLQATAEVTGATDTLQIQAMQYRNGELDLSINGKNVQSVETLRAGFARQHPLSLSVNSADASSAGVQIRATVSQEQTS